MSTPDAPFAIGDVVILRSGGPKMTVHNLPREGEVYCIWFDAKHEQKGNTFLFGVIKKVEED